MTAHDTYRHHVENARRCACSTGGQCARARDLLGAADAEDWTRPERRAALAERAGGVRP